MPSWTEFRLSCRGLFLLARFDAAFLRYFDRSAAGALRSFWLALFILPYFLFQLWFEIDETIPSAALCMVSRSVGYAYGWILFPFLILIAGRMLERAQEAPGCVAVYNWTSLIWITLQLPAEFVGLVAPQADLANGLSLAALFASVVIEGFMLMRCLRILMWQAAALVAIDVFLSYFVVLPMFHTLGCGPLW